MKKAIYYFSIFSITALIVSSCCKEDFETNTNGINSTAGISRYVYVSCSDADSISVIDATNFLSVTQLSGGTIGANSFEPRNLDVSSDGLLAYVPCRHSDNVLVIDASTKTVLDEVTDASFDEPYAAAFTSDNKEVWVVNKKGGGSTTGSITIINTTSHTVVATIDDVNISSPEGLCIANGKAYVANRGDGSVSVFNVATRSFVTSIAVGSEPRFTVSSLNGDFVYVTATAAGLTKIRTDVDTISSTINAWGRNAAMSPDGATLFVASLSSSIHMVNTSTEQVTDIDVAGAFSIYAVAIISNGTLGFATDEDNDVVYVFDPKTGALLNNGAGIPVANQPRGIAAQ